MVEYSAYVGLDVHKATISVAVALPGRENPLFQGETPQSAFIVAPSDRTLEGSVAKFGAEVVNCLCRLERGIGDEIVPWAER